jgi:hypothetical protein
VVIARRLAAIAQSFHPRRELRVARQYCATVAERAEVLGRVKTRRCGDPDGAHRAAVGSGQLRLRGVFDEREIVSRADGLERAHVGRLPVKVHRQECAGARRDRGFNGAGIERQSFRIDIREHGPRACHHHGER